MTITSFSQLRKKSSNFDDLQKKLKETTGKKDYNDNRFWRAAQDKAGNAQAVIRFLPPSKGEELPYVKLYSFGFKGPTGQWFIENCPSTINLDCPVLEANNALWDSGIDANKEVARQRKRRLSYISNIYVVSDPANPENEGKVFLFKYGQKIFEKIQAALAPEFADDEPVNVFDPWEGADFKLRIVKKEGYANYDNSTFTPSKPLFEDEDDARYEEVWNQEYSLQEFVAPDQFKSYDELKARFDKVTGASTGARTSATIDEDLQAVSETNQLKSVDEDNDTSDYDVDVSSIDEDLDDDLADFAKLVE